MEEILVDWLVAFARFTGMSGEGIASVIGMLLLIMVFTIIAASGKVFFWVLARIGYDVNPGNPNSKKKISSRDPI